MKRINLEQAITINQKIKDIESIISLNIQNRGDFRICAGEYSYRMGPPEFEQSIKAILEKEKERLIEIYDKLDKE